MPWNWASLSLNPNITWQIVQENPEKPWVYSALSENLNITSEIVQDNLDKPWHWFNLSKNPSITWQLVQDNPKKKWYWRYLSKRIGVEISSIDHAKALRKRGYKPKQIRDDALYKTVLGLPIDKPMDYMGALLWVRGIEGTLDLRIIKILHQLPPELQEKICCLVFGIKRISDATAATIQ